MIGWQVLWGVNLYVKMIVGVKVFFWLNLTLLIIVIFAKAYVICLLNIEEYGSRNIAWIVYLESIWWGIISSEDYDFFWMYIVFSFWTFTPLLWHQLN